MWLHGLIIVTFMAIAKCSETEITIEAAFQGRCGHGSPCEQLCYELHDGMYECDCTDGFELQKNGYSCQEINSTFQQENGDQLDRQLDDEDILYQKGASFSAKLDDSNIDNIETNILFNSQNSNSKNSNRNNSNHLTIEKLWRNRQQHKQQQQQKQQHIDLVVEEDDEDDMGGDGDDVDYNEKEYEYYKQTSKRIYQAKLSKPPASLKTPTPSIKLPTAINTPPALSHSVVVVTTRKSPTTPIIPRLGTHTIATTLNMYDNSNDDDNDDDDMNDANEDDNNEEDDVDDDDDDDDSDYNNNQSDNNFYSKEEDMSVYDDVNNNKLNLNNNLNDNYYQNHISSKKSKVKNRNRYRNLDSISDSNNKNINNNNKLSSNNNSSNNNNINENYLQTTTSSTPKVTTDGHDDMDIDYTLPTLQTKQQSDVVVIIMDGTTERSDITLSRCPLDCGMDGVCDFNDGSGMSGSTVSRCLCPFGKSGLKCANVNTTIPKNIELHRSFIWH